MALVISELYQALRAAGCSHELAEAAAAVGLPRESPARKDQIRHDLAQVFAVRGCPPALAYAAIRTIVTRAAEHVRDTPDDREDLREIVHRLESQLLDLVERAKRRDDNACDRPT